jgi:hypothetical protein
LQNFHFLRLSLWDGFCFAAAAAAAFGANKVLIAV